MIIKFIYTVFIGVLFAILVGVGIDAFYVSPKEPDFPVELKIQTEMKEGEPAFEEMKKRQEEYDQRFKVFQEESKTYNRNVSIIAIVFAIVTLAISLTALHRILIIADGLLLGGVLTLIYCIIRGFNSGDNMFRFIVVVIGFIIALILGYLKFIRSDKLSK